MTQRHRAGADIGGTFTDIFVIDEATGEFAIGKTLTTPDDPSRAIETGLLETLSGAGIPIEAVAQIIHGTTLVTNALIERKGQITALMATDGFRDSLEIGRENRYELYDLQLELPEPLVPRYLRFDVPQRTLADGSTRQELDTAYVERLAGELAAAGVEAIAVAFLNAFANPEAERQARAAILRAAPDMRVSISSDVAPAIREFERTSTTVCNIYVQGRVERYLRDLETRLAGAGFDGSLLLMLSSGGLATVETATRFPVRLLESGPAAGALAAAAFGRAMGHEDLLSFDLGGTTAKFAVIDRGQPLLAHSFEVDRRYRFKKGSGLPINLPVIEMIEIGAGGGSIARVNALGLLKVGPDSAGADPGPVCYGRGGTEPTVTDADLVLGYLDPAFFLGGGMALDLEGARQAIRNRIGDPLGLGIEEAAWGIHQIVNENMASAARIHALERGKDPRTLPVFAFGGAGPVHGFRVAAALGSPSVIAPFGAGVMSAVGFLSAPLAFDFVRSAPGRLADIDWSRINTLFSDMEREGEQVLGESGVAAGDITHERIAEMRYVGQGHEIRVALPNGPLGPESVPGLQAAYEAEYKRLYGRLGPPVPVEAITWRVVSSGPRPEMQMLAGGGGSANADDARKGTRRAWMPELGGMTDVNVYDRYLLAPGATFAGPAIIEERESTFIVGPGATCRVDDHWNLVATFDRPEVSA
ncbi:MAG: hydantoinase/oxoprolinase family protein [Thermomicrobiales bacterium]